jgi:hypothetical protein
VVHSSSRWIPLIVLAFAAPLAACGGTTTAAGTSSPATSAPTPTVAAVATTAAAATCPSGGTVGSALGTTLPDPTGVASPGSTTLPAGATDINCEYHTTTENVIISILTGIPASYISKFSAQFPVAFKPVSGVGDEARSFSEALGGGKNNEGLVAAKGSTVVALVATATPATLSQIESLVNSLL